MKVLPYIAAAVLVFGLLPSEAQSQWVLDGIPVGAAPGPQTRPAIVPDGIGGAMLFWVDGRNGARDLYAQRITGQGMIAAGWPINGVYAGTGHAQGGLPMGAPDGTGGAIFVWEDQRDFNTTAINIMAQRVQGDGTIPPGWPADGLPVCTAPANQSIPRIIPDGEGGAFITWFDWRDDPAGPDIYLQRITADGVVATGWPNNGLAICTVPDTQQWPTLVSDSEGGTILIWEDARDRSVNGFDIYAQRITSSGEIASGWTPNGVPVITVIGHQQRVQTVPDGQGGALLIWHDSRTGDLNIYAQRILGDGTLAPGWPADGVALCLAPERQQNLTAAPDGLGGAVVAWADYRPQANPEGGASDIYAQRVLGDGTLAPGWPADGVALCTEPNFQELPKIAPDGAGGAFVVWVDNRGSPEDVYGQHVLASGAIAPGWDPDGLAIAATSGRQAGAVITSDGMGNAIASWEDSRNFATNSTDIYAHKLGIDGPVPTLPSLVSVDADASGIRLLWYAKDARLLETSVYRRTEGSTWTYLGGPEVTGPDELRYDDADVVPGERYAYRLGYFDGGTESFTDEVWVEAAAPLAFALDGFRPNPAIGLPIVSLTLAKSEPARLEVFDLRGRLVLRRDLSGLGAGRHTVSLDDGVRLAPGVYVLRLTQDDQVARIRGVILD